MNTKPDMTEKALPFSRPYRTDDIPASGVTGSIELDNDQRSAVAGLLDIPDVKMFQFTYKLDRGQQGRFKLAGRLKVHAEQECVITLEPLDYHLDETIEISLWPPKDVEIAEKLAEEEGRTVQLDGPEPIQDGIIDVGQLAYEHLASTLDPFPKAADAAFNWQDSNHENDDDPPNKPFAGLDELLRKRAQGTGDA